MRKLDFLFSAGLSRKKVCDGMVVIQFGVTPAGRISTIRVGRGVYVIFYKRRREGKATI
jgi:hypothetical protein